MPEISSHELAEMNYRFALAAQEDGATNTVTSTGAAGEGPAGEGKQNAKENQSPYNMMVWIALLAFMFWFIVLRPQKKERDQRQQMLNTMSKGDKVVSVGGIHGKIVKINEKEKTIDVEVGPKQIMTFSRAAIQSVADKNTPKAEEEENK